MRKIFVLTILINFIAENQRRKNIKLIVISFFSTSKQGDIIFFGIDFKKE